MSISCTNYDGISKKTTFLYFVFQKMQKKNLHLFASSEISINFAADFEK